MSRGNRVTKVESMSAVVTRDMYAFSMFHHKQLPNRWEGQAQAQLVGAAASRYVVGTWKDGLRKRLTLWRTSYVNLSYYPDLIGGAMARPRPTATC